MKLIARDFGEGNLEGLCFFLEKHFVLIKVNCHSDDITLDEFEGLKYKIFVL